jgi:hypothetical protein
MSNYYAKNAETSKRERFYFYGLNRNDSDGFVTLYKIDINENDGQVPIQTPAIDVTGNRTFENFEIGVDFFEGRDVEHNLVFDNLICEQYKWDSKNINYFIDDEGNLVARINYPYQYSEGVIEYTTLAKFFPQDLNLGSVDQANPLENAVIVDLGSVMDSELPSEIIDLGNIT